jgi:hypothetical protein
VGAVLEYASLDAEFVAVAQAESAGVVCGDGSREDAHPKIDRALGNLEEVDVVHLGRFAEVVQCSGDAEVI